MDFGAVWKRNERKVHDRTSQAKFDKKRNVHKNATIFCKDTYIIKQNARSGKEIEDNDK